ncbi:MAG: AI-2E family transporter [Deltaproteobacteria bacterium]|nr:AI-2E family transporter [Deltaproteobacteria bacterium]
MRRVRLLESQRGLATTSLVILAGVALGLVLWLMRPVLVPLVLAVLLSYLLMPLVDLLQVRLRLPRLLAVSAALALAAFALGAAVMLVSSSVQGLAARAPEYQAKIVQLGHRALEWAAARGIPVDAGVVQDRLRELPVAELLVGTLNSLLSSFSTFLLVLLFVIYLLAGRTPRPRRAGLLNEMELRIRKFIAVKVLISFLTGLLTWIALYALGLELAVVFGLLAFLLNFIPSAGSVVALLLPLPVALMQFDGGARLLMVLLVPGVVQVALGNVLEPKMLGESLNLHPITVLLSLIFWGMLWGMAGMILATPITAVLAIVLDRLEPTRPVARLLAGRLDF